MYTDSDLNDAVGAGALTPEAARAFREFVAARAGGSFADEETFRLLTGFNDIFVTVALLLVLIAVGFAFPSTARGAALPFVAAGSWGLAEYFTRIRRMALPSIVLLLTFLAGVFGTIALTLGGVLSLDAAKAENGRNVLVLVGAAAATGVAAYAHWRRFHVPITVAAGTLALVGPALFLLIAFVPPLRDQLIWPLLGAGLGVFAFAMWWDMSDPPRLTRRSDTAFWLHLLAAPMIVHPVFSLFGLLQSQVPIVSALAALGCYALLAVVALVVDRRAIMVSALAYVLWATSSLLASAGAVGSTFALAAFGIGTCLLFLSAFWQKARRPLLRLVPERIAWRLPPSVPEPRRRT